MVRYLILAGCLAYVALLAVLAVEVRRAAPGPPDQAIAGVGIGSHWGGAGVAYLSGRRLACVPEERAGLRGSRCRVRVAGETLELGAWRNPPSHPNQLGGWCEARYAGRSWPCRIGSRWTASLDTPLGLSPQQLDALRREYPFENLGEGPYLAALLILPPLTAIAVAGGVLAGCWRRARRGSDVAAAALIAALAALPLTFFAVLVLAADFWD